MASKFNRDWSIDCPKCQTHVDRMAVPCSNCGERAIGMQIIRTSIANVFLGCRLCSMSGLRIDCPTCKINLRSAIEDKYSRSSGCGFMVALMLLPVAAGAMYLMR